MDKAQCNCTLPNHGNGNEVVAWASEASGTNGDTAGHTCAVLMGCGLYM